MGSGTKDYLAGRQRPCNVNVTTLHERRLMHARFRVVADALTLVAHVDYVATASAA